MNPRSKGSESRRACNVASPRSEQPEPLALRAPTPDSAGLRVLCGGLGPCPAMAKV